MVKTDVENAFGSVNRALLAAMLFCSPATKPLWRYFLLRSTDPEIAASNFSTSVFTQQSPHSDNSTLSFDDA